MRRPYLPDQEAPNVASRANAAVIRPPGKDPGAGCRSDIRGLWVAELGAPVARRDIVEVSAELSQVSCGVRDDSLARAPRLVRGSPVAKATFRMPSGVVS